jgi:hypothetical protein
LSDHLGMNDSLGLNLLKNWMALKAPLATIDNPFSTYLIGLCIVFLRVTVFFDLNSRLVADGRWYSHQIYEFDENVKKDDFFNAHCRPKKTVEPGKIPGYVFNKNRIR